MVQKLPFYLNQHHLVDSDQISYSGIVQGEPLRAHRIAYTVMYQMFYGCIRDLCCCGFNSCPVARFYDDCDWAMRVICGYDWMILIMRRQNATILRV